MKFNDLVGFTFTRIDASGDAILFVTACGKKFSMNHCQDCCESVYIDAIVGELSDIMESPIIFADESIGYMDQASESGTWTFYKLATVKGWVDIRWNGQSNGYYSESVDFCEIK